MSAPASKMDELVIDRSDGLVHVTLNRPEALNALSVTMIDQLLPVLQGGETVLVTGAGGKAFCAGGDVKMVWQALGEPGGVEKACDYFRHEYRVNAALFVHAGDYVSYLNGIVMGGGYGISAHGTHLIATEATAFAMPEVKIGFYPDVGATYHMARAPFQLGTYLALTGNTVNAADMIYAGLAHAYIPLESYASFKTALPNGVDAALERFTIKAPKDGIFQKYEDIIEHCFVHNTAEEILDALDSDGSAFALQTAGDIRARSPLSVKISLRHIRMAANDDFGDVIARDLVLARKFMENSDFKEGVRAALIDRDRHPRWFYPSLEAVTPQVLALYLSSPED